MAERRRRTHALWLCALRPWDELGLDSLWARRAGRPSRVFAFDDSMKFRLSPEVSIAKYRYMTIYL